MALLCHWGQQSLEDMMSLGTDFETHAIWQGYVEEPTTKDFVARKARTFALSKAQGNQQSTLFTSLEIPSSEVQNKMIFMGHQILSCHVPVVRSFFIYFKIISSSWNCWYDHLPKYINITLKLPNMTFDKSKKTSCNELLSSFSASKAGPCSQQKLLTFFCVYR